jgi:hypothetical protein
MNGQKIFSRRGEFALPLPRFLCATIGSFNHPADFANAELFLLARNSLVVPSTAG